MMRLVPVLLLLMMCCAPPMVFAADEGKNLEVSAKVDALSTKVSSDMRRIQREIAALRADLGKPGMSEMFSGLGYIFGLFGVAFFVAGRRRSRE